MAKKNLDLGKLGSKKKVIKKADDDLSVDEQEIIKQIHSTKGSSDVTRITVDVPSDLHARMKMRVFSQKTTIRDYVLGLVQEDLNKQ
ncbi:hypothetical protein [Calothrix rhizosoleniae]|uniref:hypothetical protein n=1 Tax=Calothrix rhizosoleniae TaxID=888997 RepID=UPI000B49FA8D|nr:hypothetical protein [Calothrix rhizosoleniae]